MGLTLKRAEACFSARLYQIYQVVWHIASWMWACRTDWLVLSSSFVYTGLMSTGTRPWRAFSSDQGANPVTDWAAPIASLGSGHGIFAQCFVERALLFYLILTAWRWYCLCSFILSFFNLICLGFMPCFSFQWLTGSIFVLSFFPLSETLPVLVDAECSRLTGCPCHFSKLPVILESPCCFCSCS